jgi:hypothetical protein
MATDGASKGSVLVAIEELIDVVAPPTDPKETASLAAWKHIEDQLGIRLPEDYYAFASAYGTGTFNDPGRLCIWISNPFAPTYLASLEFHCKLLRRTESLYWPEKWPYKAYPERPGLFPWGDDDNGSTLLWLTSGPCDQWPIFLNPGRSMDLIRVDLPMTTFLAKSFSKELDCPIWDEPEFFSGPRKVKFARDRSEIEYQ